VRGSTITTLITPIRTTNSGKRDRQTKKKTEREILFTERKKNNITQKKKDKVTYAAKLCSNPCKNKIKVKTAGNIIIFIKNQC
jgi:hypothetical protein